jgi:hypothetical protein
MGYFDAVTSGTFKTTPDGRRLFFPWGVLGGGYSIASAEEYDRLPRRIKTYLIASVVLIVGANLFAGYVACFVMAAIFCTFYFGWMWFLLPHLEPSGEKMTLNESMTTQALAHGEFGLAVMILASLVLIGGGVVMLVADPNHKLIAIACILLFGLCVAFFARLVILRRRATHTER